MNGYFSIKNRQILALVFCSVFTLAGYSKSLDSNSSCYSTKDKRICDVTVESIKGGPQFLEFEVPKGIKEVEVGVQMTVEKGVVSAWLEDSMQKKVQATVKKDQYAVFKGLAEAQKSFYNIPDGIVFRLYLDPHRDILLKKAEDIKIKITYGLPSKQNSKPSPVEQLKQVFDEEIALSPTKLGTVKLVTDQQNQYIATQIFHPFDDLKSKQKDKASSLGWKSGQLVKIWIFKDWEVQVCKSNLKEHEGCIETIAQNRPIEIEKEYQKVKDLDASANLYLSKNKYTESEKNLTKENSNEFNYDPDVALSNFFQSLENQNEFSKIKKKYQRVLNLDASARVHASQNRPLEAEKEHQEALKIVRELAKKNPDIFNYIVAIGLNNLANLHLDQNRFLEAKKGYKEALKIYKELAKKNSDMLNSYVASTLCNLAILHMKQNRLTEAKKGYQEALEIYKGLVKKNPDKFNLELAKALFRGYYYQLDKTIDPNEIEQLLKKYPNEPDAKTLLKALHSDTLKKSK